MIEEHLKELGLNEKQVTTYLALMEKGRTSPAELSDITGINRTTIYAVAKELASKGLIAEDLAGKNSYLTALPPESVGAMLQREEIELKKKRIVAQQAMEELRKLTRDTRYSIPKIHFVHEDEVEGFLHKQAKTWVNSIMKYDTIWWGFQDTTFLKFHQSWIDSFWKSIPPKNLSVRLLTNQSKFESEMVSRGYTNRTVKYWNGDGKFSATTWVAGDYLIMIVTNQKPHYLVQIYDVRLAENMRELFKGIWEGIR